jgi:hypothetical protein
MPFFSSIESALASLPAGAHSDRNVLFAARFRPFRQRHQRVGIDEENPLTLLMGGDGEAGGKRALPRAAFLGHECNRMKFSPPLALSAFAA